MGKNLTSEESVRIAAGRRLKSMMKLHGYTATKLAADSGISLATILNLVHGKREMHLDDLQKISKVLGISPGWLAWGD